jgi:TolA-binding protein
MKLWWPFKKKPTTKIEKKEESENMAATQTTEAQLKTVKAKIKDLELDNSQTQLTVRNLSEQIDRLTLAVEQLRSAVPSLSPNQKPPTRRS